jgi:hypothetical protein
MPLFSKSFVGLALNGCGSPVETVAVVGVRVTKIPESRVSMTLAVLAGFCLDSTVMMICRPGYFVGSGRTLGAVYVAVAGAVVTSLVSVPNEPSEGQFTALEVVVLLLVVVVVVYWQPGVQMTSVSVAPFTVAVMVVDWLRIIVFPSEEVTVTVITFAPELPQPLNPRRQTVAAAINARLLDKLRNFISRSPSNSHAP